MGKVLIIIPKVARNKILAVAHITAIAGHFGRDRTLHAIRSSMDWPGVARGRSRYHMPRLSEGWPGYKI